MFDGFCEVINAVMVVISILASLCHADRITKDCIAAKIAAVTVIFHLAKFFHMAVLGSFDKCEIVVVVMSILLIYLYYRCTSSMRAEVHGIIPALLVTVATGVLETIRDIYTAAYNDKDGGDCPFV